MNKSLLQLTGIVICLALAFAANNVFVYIVCVLVIATLITDVSFIEVLMAILWKNDEYFKTKLETKKLEDSKKSQENNIGNLVPINEITPIFEEYGKKTKDMENKITALTDENEKNKIYLHYERTYRLIFGSQIRFLEQLKKSKDYKIPLTQAQILYKLSPVFPNYPEEDYFKFLINYYMVGFENTNGDNFYLTTLGNGFLDYLTELNIRKDKIN